MKVFQKESSLKGENLLLEEQILSFKEKGGKIDNGRVASPESVSFTLCTVFVCHST